MKTILIAAASAAAAFLACASGARAGGPYVVDDAGTARAGRCQIETWISDGRRGRAWVAAPACATRGDRSVEWTLGLRGQDGETWLSPAAKRTFAAFADGRIAVAGSLAAEVRSDGGPVTAALNVPVTVQASDGLLVHLNLGWIQTDGDGHATWGINAERRLTARITAIAETFGDDQGGRGWQAGLRYAAVPDRLDLDVTVGQPDADRDGPRWTIGLAAAF